MARYRLVWLLLAAIGMTLPLAACDGGEERPPATPSGTAQVQPFGTGATGTPATGAGTPAGPSLTGTPAAPTRTSVPATPLPTIMPTGLPSVGFDMDPTGNSCPGTGSEDCTLGTIEECISVPNVAGQTFTIDTFIRGLPNGFLAWNHNLNFPDTASAANLTMTAATVTDPAVNLIAQSPKSVPLDVSEGMPDAESGHSVGVAEAGTAEATPPFTQGVLGRFTFTVGEGATSGLYELTLDPTPVSAFLDKDANEYDIDVMGSGLVALGQDCP